jgi:voltage-gated potassium channel
MAATGVPDNERPVGSADFASEAAHLGRPEGGWRLKLFSIIFESDTRAGRIFDTVLIAAILLSVAVVLADSVESVSKRHGALMDVLEWVFTLLFTAEYIGRLAAVRHPLLYARSFFGIIDLLAIFPSYFVLFVPEANALIDIRILRMLRVFRIFKLVEFFSEFNALGAALVASRRKIVIFLFVVSMIVVLMGTLMYLVEGPKHGFTSIPAGIYWAIVTLTTVGYGDLAPHTDVGRFLAAIMMLLGWGIIAVPTGIVTSEMTARHLSFRSRERICGICQSGHHEPSAKFCKDCGAPLPDEGQKSP